MTKASPVPGSFFVTSVDLTLKSLRVGKDTTARSSPYNDLLFGSFDGAGIGTGEYLYNVLLPDIAE